MDHAFLAKCFVSLSVPYCLTKWIKHILTHLWWYHSNFFIFLIHLTYFIHLCTHLCFCLFTSLPVSDHHLRHISTPKLLRSQEAVVQCQYIHSNPVILSVIFQYLSIALVRCLFHRVLSYLCKSLYNYKVPYSTVQRPGPRTTIQSLSQLAQFHIHGNINVT